jgi:spermidine/putrescine ABC transporter ATP-binding subunit
MTADAFISIRNVKKYFGSFQAIDNINLDIGHGEFFSLLGASGCGKTTILRMLAGFESPTSGEILIDGHPMNDVPPYLRPVNMVFQNYAIFPHLNVRDNIAYGLRKRKLPRATRHAMVDEMLAMINLPGYGDRKAHELSGGQRQRIALARSLILRPKALLLDEPLGALDKQLRERMQLELRALQRQVGITFVFVTHDQEEAMTLSDRIAVMANGKVLQVDSPSGLYDTPISREVASFIGTMNFFAGEVAGMDGDSLVVTTEGFGRVTLPSRGRSYSKGQRLDLAIRPEKLKLSQDAPNDTALIVAGRLVNMVYLGERSHFHMTLDGMEQPVAVSTLNDRPLLGGFDQGATVWLRCDPDAIVVLAQV